MRQVAAETARGHRSDPYGQRRPMSGGYPPRPQGSGPGPRPPGGRPGRYERGPGGPPRGQHPSRSYGNAAPMPRPDRPHRERPHREGREQPEHRPHRDDRPRGPRKPFRTGVQSAGEGPPRPVPAPELPPLARIRTLVTGYQTTAVLLAAYSLGVFTEVQRRPQVLADLARHCGADPRGLAPLLDALVGLGVLHRHGATYVLPRDLATYLVPGVDGDGTGLIDAAPDQVFAWMDLARSVREGEQRQVFSSEGLLASDPERVRRYIRSVHTTTRESCRRVVEMAPLLPGSTLVDVGGGSGIFAAEYVRRTPDLKAYLFDLPPTIEIAREILRSEGLEDAVEYVPGDYRRDPFPGPVDTVLISNVFQTESEGHCLSILRRAREALRPGGTLLVHGGMGDETSTIPAPLALFSVMMYLFFDEGRLWSADKVSQWLAAEGFGVRSIRPLGPPFLSKLILATRLD